MGKIRQKPSRAIQNSPFYRGCTRTAAVSPSMEKAVYLPEKAQRTRLRRVRRRSPGRRRIGGAAATLRPGGARCGLALLSALCRVPPLCSLLICEWRPQGKKLRETLAGSLPLLGIFYVLLSA
ncbi:hypothetical protein NL676_030180 [Syzygium grande]|nr:hypothetical protein NL676_030180 [Syzygium grande]